MVVYATCNGFGYFSNLSTFHETPSTKGCALSQSMGPFSTQSFITSASMLQTVEGVVRLLILGYLQQMALQSTPRMGYTNILPQEQEEEASDQA